MEIYACEVLRPASIFGSLDFAPYKIQRLYTQETWATASHAYISRIPVTDHGRRVRVDAADY